MSEFNPNAPVQTLGEAITMITERLEGLIQSIGENDQKTLEKITRLWEKGVKEISEHGGLTLPSCKKMSALLIIAESDAKREILGGGEVSRDLNFYEGIKRIHDTMQLVSIQQGINEGNKDCCPYCGGC